MSFPDPDPTPTLISGEQMSKLLAVNDVHPESKFARNCMSGHFYLDAADGKQYAVAAWFDQNRDEQSPAAPSRASRPHQCLDTGDLVARAMGLPVARAMGLPVPREPLSEPLSSPHQAATVGSLEFATPQARRNFDLVVSAMRGDR